MPLKPRACARSSSITGAIVSAGSAMLSGALVICPGAPAVRPEPMYESGR